jgi:2-phosphoglycerate kinase
MNKVILIGGSPTAGKSYTARKIAEELKLPWISTDTIRDQMRGLVRKEDYPALFRFNNATVEMGVEYLTNTSAADIVKIEVEENADTWKGVKALIDRDYTWKSFIVEGVALLPKLVAQQMATSKKQTLPFFLIDDDVERLRQTIYTRGLWDAADKYPDSVKEKEIAWVLEYNKYLEREAKAYNLPIIKIDKERKSYIQEILKQINNAGDQKIQGGGREDDISCR